ncbi:MAG: hypothetical protein RI920_182 [Pseudomonadota bacterium]|jgi:hypothetical protein
MEKLRTTAKHLSQEIQDRLCADKSFTCKLVNIDLMFDEHPEQDFIGEGTPNWSIHLDAVPESEREAVRRAVKEVQATHDLALPATMFF